MMNTSLHGVLFIDKPSGVTSHDVVAKARRILNVSAVGHTGTLDPLASGLMVLLIGEGTKISEYILTGDKGYEVLVRLGLKTDTWDITGRTLSQMNVQLDPEIVRSEAVRLRGSIELPVPVYSAVKVEGKKLYEYARKEQEVKIPRRVMGIEEVQILEAGKDFVRARIVCTKGTFIRSWAAELGERLDVGGVVAELRRFYSQPYSLENAITLEALAESVAQSSSTDEFRGLLGKAFVPLAECLPNWKALTVGGRDEKLMTHGQIPHDLVRRLVFEQKMANREDRSVGIKIMSASHGQLLSLLEAQPFKGLKIRRIFKVLE